MKKAFKSWYDLNQKQRIKRWENVLRVLKGLTKKQRENNFNMGSWLQYDPKCGTVGCAAGHCGLDPYFRSLGFEMNITVVNEDPDNLEWTENFSPAAYDPKAFFGSYGHNAIFLNTSAEYEEIIYLIEKYLVDLRYSRDEDA